jgi:nucleoside-diphosphate-sugar epimerase
MSNMTFSSYGTLKALGDHYVKTVNGLVVKFWNIYGIEHDLEKSHVITDFIVKAMKSRVIDMISDGQEERQMLYADDCCECLCLLAERYESIPRSRQLHISSFAWSRIIDIADLVAGMFPGTKVLPANLVDDVQRAMRNEPDPFILDLWQPRTSLKDGIRRVADYYETRELASGA